MPNEPAFDSAKQLQMAGAVGIDHVEGQASFSISDYIGVVGSFYKGYTGGHIYQAGINYYTPLKNNPDIYFSATLGIGSGKHSGKKYAVIPLIVNKEAIINTQYNNLFFQMGFILSRKNLNKTLFVLTVEQIFFKNYDVELTNLSGSDQYYYTIKMSAKNKIAYQSQFAIIHYFQRNTSNIYWQVQYGFNITDGFNIKNIQTITGNYKTDEKINYDKIIHPMTMPLFLNISLGIKLDFNKY